MNHEKDPHEFKHALELSPLRHSSRAADTAGLVREQLLHFGIEPDSPYGIRLAGLVEQLFAANSSAHELWELTASTLTSLDRSDRIACFNAKRFVCFQLAKILDTLQNPLRSTYQSLAADPGTIAAKGPYPLFDNVTALFSGTPVITRTATYIYACTEWIEDAFRGQEFLHEIYSRLLNPTSICLANHIVDLEAGRESADYFALNFNSGMAAIDATLAHLLGYGDIVLASRNVYGGTYQLLHDWYGKKSNLDVSIEWFDGDSATLFEARLLQLEKKYSARLAQGRQIFVYLESPCNPHGEVLDVPEICRIAHARGLTVICDATVATPFLYPSLKRQERIERPDFVIHSYTKDLCGSGNTTAGVVIARNERMFMAKGQVVKATGHDGIEREHAWDETLFWNVYYVKGAFLDADKAFEVLSGMHTVELRLLAKCINTIVLSKALALHPAINVHCPALEDHPNAPLRERLMRLGLPAPLFTIDFEGTRKQPLELPPDRLKRFFDNLEPAFGLQVSLGQTNTMVLCPALTSHSELSNTALADAGITRSTMRISVGDEDPRYLIEHLKRTASFAFGDLYPDFAAGFPSPEMIDALYERTYLDVHGKWVRARIAGQ
jgi:cystathionine beta-lyase/cystathionine gamma-synthase